MRVIPVMDVMDGRVVHAVGGQREHYRPLADSCLAGSSDPLDVAAAFRNTLEVTSIYLADLDAIMDGCSDSELYARIAGLDLCLWVDAGVRTHTDARRIRDAGAGVVIAGLETLANPDELRAMGAAIGFEALGFSLDLRNGRPLTDKTNWSGMDPFAIACAAVDMGVQRMIVLDLARVGNNNGVGTQSLCQSLVQHFPDVEIHAGGGIRSLEDLEVLQQVGVRGALVGTALHDGRIRKEQIDRLARCK